MNQFSKISLPAMLKGNPYPGRSIAIGLTPDGTRAVILYFIMGRSENSRNRIFAQREEDVVIFPYDESKVEDPSLIIYSPVKSCKVGKKYCTIVTNGDQTDTIYEAFASGQSLEAALKTRCFEPDAPNYTPRISGVLFLSSDCDNEYMLSILKSIDQEGTACVREFFSFPLIPGMGHFISTYVTDGSPLPSFEGEPLRIDIPDCIEDFANDIWTSLHSENKISLFVRSIALKSGNIENIVINRHTEV